MQNFIAITSLQLGWDKNEFFIGFELWWKNRSRNGPLCLANTWTIDDLSVRPSRTKCNGILFAVQTFLFEWVNYYYWQPFLDNQQPCNPYKPCNHNLYIEIIIFTHNFYSKKAFGIVVCEKSATLSRSQWSMTYAIENLVEHWFS